MMLRRIARTNFFNQAKRSFIPGGPVVQKSFMPSGPSITSELQHLAIQDDQLNQSISVEELTKKSEEQKEHEQKHEQDTVAHYYRGMQP